MERVGAGDQLAEITNGVVGLFSRYYGRGPTKAKSYLLDDRCVFTVLEDTQTVVERRLVELGKGDLVRAMRLRFQEAMAEEFKAVVAGALDRRVVNYHSQLSLSPDLGFEFFMLEER